MSEFISIPLYKRNGDIVGYALIDVEDAPVIERHAWNMTRSRSGVCYAVRYHHTPASHRTIAMHRVILGVDDQPKNIQVDHIDRDGLNNRRRNLRLATHAQNAQNIKKLAGRTSQYRGVIWHSKRQRWRAGGELGDRRVYLGEYTDEHLAGAIAAAWRAAHMTHAVDSPELIAAAPTNWALRRVNTLTVDSAEEIRRLYAEGGITQGQLAKRFDVAKSTIWRAIKGVSWPHADDAQSDDKGTRGR